MLVLYQEWAEAVLFSAAVFNVNNGVLLKRTGFFQTDTNISSFQTGIHPCSVAYTNMSNDTQSGFPFSPTGHSRNKPYGGDQQSFCIAKVRTNLLG